MITRSRLVAALQKKYRSPQDVLRRLGVDESLISSGGDDPRKEMRAKIENVMAEIGLTERQASALLECLDQVAPYNTVSKDDPNTARARQLAGARDQDARVDQFKAFLRSRGLGKDDAEAAADMLPRDAIAGGFDGQFSARGASDMAMDYGARSEAELEDFFERFPDARRIGVGY